MNDDDVLCAVRDAVGRVPVPVRPEPEVVMARGRSRRRRVRGITGAAAVAAVAAGTVAGLGIADPSGSTTPVSSHAQLAAFSVVSNPNGTATVSISLGQLFDPAALRQALAAHGIPALVTEGSFCQSNQMPAAALQAVRPGPLSAGPKGNSQAVTVMTINPRALPTGDEVSIGDFGSTAASFTVIDENAYTCKNAPWS